MTTYSVTLQLFTRKEGFWAQWTRNISAPVGIVTSFAMAFKNRFSRSTVVAVGKTAGEWTSTKRVRVMGLTTMYHVGSPLQDAVIAAGNVARVIYTHLVHVLYMTLENGKATRFKLALLAFEPLFICVTGDVKLE